jgi:allophanate hydrolase subunit 2
LRLRIYRGPRDYWFDDDSFERLATAEYIVTSASNRIGIRLKGPAITARSAESLPSEGVALGSIQVPPNGQPIIFSVDHPTTGGYPVIGVMHPDDLWLVGQAAPGTTIQFLPRLVNA